MKKHHFLLRFFTDDSSFVRPFFVFLSLILLAIYIWTVTTALALAEPWRMVMFTLLMALLVSLYWVSPYIARSQRGVWSYLIGMGMLVFVIIWLADEAALVFALYPSLVGPVFGLLRSTMRRFMVILFYLVLSFFSTWLIAGLQNIQDWLFVMLPALIYVVIFVATYVRQSEVRERAEQQARELEAANRQLAEYAAQVEDLTLLAERQRMARELHDTLSQGLAGLILQIEAADAHLSGGRTEKAQEIIQQTMTRARTTLAEARRVISELRQPPRVESLEESIRSEVMHFTEATGIECDLVMLRLPTEAPDQVCEPALRVISEGLTNVARHARASRAQVELRGEKGMLEIEISDDGVGFDPTAVQAGHYGLVGMRERIRLAGGVFTVKSSPGKGTRLLARLPCPEVLEASK